VKAGDVIFIMLHRIKGTERQIREEVWMPFCWLIGISYSFRSKSAMRC